MEKLIHEMSAKYEDYLSDESRLKGMAESISFPKTLEEIKWIVDEMNKKKETITIQGGKTGICGGCVPNSGHILNLKNFNRILEVEEKDGEYFLNLEAGVTLGDLKEFLRKDFSSKYLNGKNKQYVFPIEPTEKNATLGGIISTNAKGISSEYYGEIKDYLEEVVFLTAKGDILTINKNDDIKKFSKYLNFYQQDLEIYSKLFKGIESSNLLDVIIGSEGIYGIIISLKIRIVEKISKQWGLLFNMDCISQLYFINNIKKMGHKKLGIVSLEYFDENSLKLLKSVKEINEKLQELPDFQCENKSLTYLEIHRETDEEVEETASQIMELAFEAGCEEEFMWALSEDEGLEKFRNLRHFLPELINMKLDRVNNGEFIIHKLSSDMYFKNKDMLQTINFYKSICDEKKLEYYIFGHALGTHLHINILSKNQKEFEEGKLIFENWVENSKLTVNNIFHEHGIGKIKVNQLNKVLSNNELEKLKSLKFAFDENYLLNVGNKF